MKTVFCQTNWCTPTEFLNVVRQHDIGFKHVSFVDVNNADYSAIFNSPTQPYRHDNSFYFQCEPAPIRGGWSANVKYDFSIPKWQMPVFLGFRSPKRWDEIEIQPHKTRGMCAILSSKNYLEGHVKRNHFAKLLPQLPSTEVMGGLVNRPIDDKYDILPKYRYTFNAENYAEPNYFTEKITDAILCECLCFYWGCPNLDEFIDPRCYIRIDLCKPEEALEQVRMHMANFEWEKRIEYIREEKRKIIHEKQIFAWIDNHVGYLEAMEHYANLPSGA